MCTRCFSEGLPKHQDTNEPNRPRRRRSQNHSQIKNVSSLRATTMLCTTDVRLPPPQQQQSRMKAHSHPELPHPPPCFTLHTPAATTISSPISSPASNISAAWSPKILGHHQFGDPEPDQQVTMPFTPPNVHEMLTYFTNTEYRVKFRIHTHIFLSQLFLTLPSFKSS